MFEEPIKVIITYFEFVSGGTVFGADCNDY
jgi:hypothetical protein